VLIADFVKALSEVVQPIFGHSELSTRASTECKDRLTHIVSAYRAMEAALERALARS